MKILNCRIVLLCVFFLLSFFLSAQQRSVDSIIALLKTSNDTAYIERCFQISDEFKNSRRIDLCFKYMDSAMQRAILIKSLRYEAFVYNNYGNTYNYLSDFPNALNNFEKAIRIQKKIGNVRGESSNMLNKGNTYFYSSEYNKAEKCYRKALYLYKLSPVSDETEANIYINLGSACAAQDKYDEATTWFFKALKLSDKSKDYIGSAYCYNNLGNTYLYNRQFSEAQSYMQKALDLKLKYGDNYDKADAYANMASVYDSLKDYKRSLEFLEKSLTYRDTSIYNTSLQVLYKNFTGVYEKLNNMAGANKYYKILTLINSSILKKEITAQVQRQDMMNEFSKSHLRDSLVQASYIQKQNAQIERSNTVKYFLMIIVGVIIIFMALLFKRYKVTQAQKEVISQQKELVDEKQKEIMDSIKYARRLQNSLMPTEKYIERVLKSIRKDK